MMVEFVGRLEVNDGECYVVGVAKVAPISIEAVAAIAAVPGDLVRVTFREMSVPRSFFTLSSRDGQKATARGPLTGGRVQTEHGILRVLGALYVSDGTHVGVVYNPDVPEFASLTRVLYMCGS